MIIFATQNAFHSLWTCSDCASNHLSTQIVSKKTNQILSNWCCVVWVCEPWTCEHKWTAGGLSLRYVRYTIYTFHIILYIDERHTHTHIIYVFFFFFLICTLYYGNLFNSNNIKKLSYTKNYTRSQYQYYWHEWVRHVHRTTEYTFQQIGNWIDILPIAFAFAFAFSFRFAVVVHYQYYYYYYYFSVDTYCSCCCCTRWMVVVCMWVTEKRRGMKRNEKNF